MRFYRFIVLFLISIACSSIYTQNGYINTYPDENPFLLGFDEVIVDNDTLIVMGLSSSPDSLRSIYFARIDTFGNIINDTFINDPPNLFSVQGEASVNNLVKYDANHYLIFGEGNGLDSLNIIKVSKKGVFEVFTYAVPPGNKQRLAYSINIVQNSIFISGPLQNENFNLNIFLIKLNKKTFAQEWYKEYGHYEKSEYNTGTVYNPYNNELIFWGGKAPSLSSDYNHHLLAVDTSGNHLWEWEAEQDTAIDLPMTDFLPLSDGGFIISGAYLKEETINLNNYTGLIRKYNADYNLEWEFQSNDTSYFYLNKLSHLHLDHHNNIMASGPNFPGIKLLPTLEHYTVNLTLDGHINWQRWDTVGYKKDTNTWLVPKGMDFLSSGSSVHVGNYYFLHDGRKIPYLIKIGKDGCIYELCNELYTSVHQEYLSKVEDDISIFPNPGNGQLIHFESQYDVKEVYILNSNGVLLDKMLPDNEKSIILKSSINPGLYVLLFKTDKGIISKRWVKM